MKIKFTIEIDTADDAALAAQLRALTQDLGHSTQPLADAVAAAGGEAGTAPAPKTHLSHSPGGFDHMNPLDQAFADLATQVTATTGAEDSAAALIPGLAAQLTAALAAGNPAQQIAKVRDVIAALTTHTDPLAAAVAANPLPTPPPAP